jgi:hypothetical protein
MELLNGDEYMNIDRRIADISIINILCYERTTGSRFSVIKI